LLEAASGVVVIAEDQQGRVDPQRLEPEPDGARANTNQA
jgi:hypothetical protein